MSASRSQKVPPEPDKVNDGPYLKELARQAEQRPRTTVVLFVAHMNELTARALAVGGSLTADRFEAVTLASNTAAQQQLRRTWAALEVEVPLVVVATRFGGFLRPATQYVRSLRPAADHAVVVLIPELVLKHWYEKIFYRKSGARLKAALLRIPWVAVVCVPVQLDVKLKNVPAVDSNQSL